MVQSQISIIDNEPLSIKMSSIKIIVMGVGGVGKSAITNRFVIGRWVEKVSFGARDFLINFFDS